MTLPWIVQVSSFPSSVWMRKLWIYGFSWRDSTLLIKNIAFEIVNSKKNLQQERKNSTCSFSQKISGSIIQHSEILEQKIYKLLGWLEWSSWDSCSKSCNGGIQERTRTCEGGRKCEGRGREGRVCNPFSCEGILFFWSKHMFMNEWTVQIGELFPQFYFEHLKNR